MNAKAVKAKLNKCITEVSENKNIYCKNPCVDFTRNRKLPFDRVIKTILSFEGKSLNNELLDLYNPSELVTSSAFVQQRSKINANAFYDLFRSFSAKTVKPSLYSDYRLVAVDGSDIHTPTNSDDIDSYCEGSKNQSPFNMLHLNALYDICSRTYIDALVQKKHNHNEYKALIEMLKRNTFDSNTIIIADRGYESYNNFANIHERNLKYLFRVKDIHANGIASSFRLPDEEFDISVDLNLTRKQNKQTKELFKDQQHYRFIPVNVTFDYLPDKCNPSEAPLFYNLKFRIVRFKISDNSYETIITNLDLPVDEIKKIYAMRWGVETSFRKLKYNIGLLFFHSKKAELILQEIFAKLTLYNFTELIASIHISKGNRKYDYQVNFSAAVNICRKLFLNRISPHECEALIAAFLLPIRLNRNFKRNIFSKHAFGFSYRVS